MSMKRIYVCSPLSAPTRDEVLANMRLARELCLYAMLLKDVAAYAPHGFYPEFLDDANEPERLLGLDAGEAWLRAADELWVYETKGISRGMSREIEIAARADKLIIWSPSCWSGVGAS